MRHQIPQIDVAAQQAHPGEGTPAPTAGRAAESAVHPAVHPLVRVWLALSLMLAGALVGCSPDTADQLSKDIVRMIRSQLPLQEEADLDEVEERPIDEDLLDDSAGDDALPAPEDEQAVSIG